MKQFLGKVKFWMDKFLSIACAVLLSFMTILVPSTSTVSSGSSALVGSSK